MDIVKSDYNIATLKIIGSLGIYMNGVRCFAEECKNNIIYYNNSYETKPLIIYEF